MVRPFILADLLSPLLERRRALLAGWAVRLRRNRRRPVRDGEPPCADRPLRRQYPVGVLQRRGVPLASIDLALAHARLPALRTGTWWPSYYERSPARSQYGPGVCRAREVTPPSPPARLLAVAPVQRCPAADAPRREAPLAGYGCAGELGRSARRPRDPLVRGRSLAGVPSRERRRRVCELSRKDLLAE